MPNTKRTMRSEYMEWVKTLPAVDFNLAISGVKNYPLSGLEVDFSGFALSGPGAYGYPPLKAALAHKCGVSEDCVTTAQGTSMANFLAMAAILEPGDEVVMEHPSYPLLWETAEYVGASARFFKRSPQQRYTVDLDALSKAVTPQTRLIVLTNLHNPSCALLDDATLRWIGKIAESVGARVLVDEVYLDLLFDATPASAFHLGPAFVTTNSLTKVYGLSGLRCGWVLAEPELTYRMQRLNDLFGVNNPHVTDQLSCVALQQLSKVAQCSRDLLDANRQLANQFLMSTPELEAEPLKVGTVLFPRSPVPVDKLCEYLRERYSTIVTPGRFFGADDHIRIGMAGDTAVVSGGLSRIHDALRDLTSR